MKYLKHYPLIIVIAICIVILLLYYMNFMHCYDKKSEINGRLILVQGTVLSAFYDNTYKIIKRADTFYGYGWIGNGEIYVAYQPTGYAEAYAVIEVIDFKSSKTVKVTTIGGAGDSNFDINKITKKIVYNDTDGIKVLTIKNHSFDIKTIKSDPDAWGPFWLNVNTIVYMHADKEREQIEKISVD
jgi:hypothetical protein